MRSKTHILRAAIPLVLFVLVAAPAVRGPMVPRPHPVKPIRVWEGIGGWYGPGFNRRKTADGEIFNMYAPTAAHPTLPIGSLVRVVNPTTGQSRVVRINDRGPFAEGREIDVSYEVARSLGLERRGLARVRMELLKVPERRWPPTRSTD